MSYSKIDGTAHTAQHRVLSACERSTGMPHSRLATIACGVGLLGSASAWLPCGVTTGARAVAGARAHRGEGRQAAALTPLKSSTRDGVERPDLAALKKGFEQSMDGKLVMEYVTVCALSRCRCRRVFRFLCGTGTAVQSSTRPEAALRMFEEYEYEGGSMSENVRAVFVVNEYRNDPYIFGQSGISSGSVACVRLTLPVRLLRRPEASEVGRTRSGMSLLMRHVGVGTSTDGVYIADA